MQRDDCLRETGSGVTTPPRAGPVAISSNRWWIYQRERFPLFAHGLLILAFSFSAVAFSHLLRRQQGIPSLPALVVAFVTSLLFFLQLRIADEFKDFDEDARHRPYRPVPRGLVTLGELGVVFLGGAAIQLALALWLFRPLALLLAGVWIYLAAMTREFFVRDWIKVRPLTYLWTHMLIIPLVDFYATACDWQVAGAAPPHGLMWFLAISFFNGVVLEIGRKIRAPGDEETGVQTYSMLWGRQNAVLAWFGALVLTGFFAVTAARRIDFAGPVMAVVAALLVVAAWVGLRFLRRPVTARAKLFEHVSGLWTLLMYLSLGAVPLLVHAAR